MAALLSPFVVLCLLCLGVVPASSSDYREFHITNTQVSNVSFTTHILFPFTAVRSQLDCGRQCASHQHCQAFSYVHGPPRSCQGYSEKKASGDPHEDLPHASTFNVNGPAIPGWNGAPCVSDQDCVSQVTEAAQYQTDELPVCYKQLCLCRTGWFYSVSRKLCVQDCPQGQLQSSYTMYPGTGVDYNNDYFFNGDEDHCKRECAALSDCENFETDGFRCQGARVSGESINEADEPWNLYQRDCA